MKLRINDPQTPESLTRRRILEAGTLMAAVGAATPVLGGRLPFPGLVRSCNHVITLRNVGAVTTATGLRLSASTPGTQILHSVVPPGWVQVAQYPNSVTWRLANGATVPAGDPIAGLFSIDVNDTPQIDARVLVEWLSARGATICRQLLAVNCPDFAGPFVDRPDNRMGPEACRCLTAETDADDTAEEYSEPDLEVTLGTPVPAGYLKVMVPYTIDVEPAQLQFTRHWDVTVMDAMQNELPVTVPTADNLNGQATFTLPHAGIYNFYLTATDPASCVNPADREDDENSDTDSATYRMTQQNAVIKAVNTTNPCDPRVYQFSDGTYPAGTNPTWTIPGSSIPLYGSPVTVQFPSLNQAYTVRMDSGDPDNFGYPREPAFLTVTPVPKPDTVDFQWSPYNGCERPTPTFPVQFHNESSVANACPATFAWDFGDGSAPSIALNPSHTYTQMGNHTVKLTMTLPASGQTLVKTKQIHIGFWMPTITHTDCGDGTISFETPGLCNFNGECDLTWSFPGGVWDQSIPSPQQVLVCYEHPGTYTASLTATSPDGAHCTRHVQITIANVGHYCSHDKITTDSPFTYNGGQYQLHTVAKFHGRFIGRIFAKTKLQRHKHGHWFRVRAKTVQVFIAGAVSPNVLNLCTGNDNTVSGHKIHYNRAKASKWNYPQVGKFDVRLNELNCTHFVQVDNGHTNGFTFVSHLGGHCDCAGH